MALVGVRKGSWTEEEDLLLKKCINKYGEGSWRLVPSRAGLNRCRKSCRLRWVNYLKPDIKRGNFGFDEVDLIVRLHKLLGNRWSLIAGRLPGRTGNDVKNFWNTHMHKTDNPIGTANDMNNNDVENSKAFKIIKPQPRTFSKKLILGKKSTRSNNTSITKYPDKVSSSPPLEIDDNIMQCWETMFANNSKEKDICGEPNLLFLSGSEKDDFTAGRLLWSDEILPGVEENDNNLLQEKQNGSLDDISIDMDFWDSLNSNW